MGLKCQILIQRAKHGVFRPGQPVVGTVKYFIAKPTKFRTIDISFLGKGMCRWSEPAADKTSIEYNNKEEYVNVNRNLFRGTDKQEVVLSGTFEYPFEFLLPDDIPSSIKTNTGGKIEYKVIVILFVKAKEIRTINEFSKEVLVYGYVSPCCPEPLIFALQADVFSLKPNNKINVKAEIDRTFLTPGENIRLKLMVHNDADFPITIKTELFEYFTYISDCKKTRVVNNSVKTTKTKSTSIVEKSVSMITIIVPTLSSLYSIQHAKIMKGEFKVRVTAKLPFPYTNAEAEVPVVIGERRDHLGAAGVGYDDGNPSCSKTPEKDVKLFIDRSVPNMYYK